MYVDCGNTYFSMFWENGQNVYPVSISLIDIKYIFTCHQYNPIRGENASISIQCMYVFMYVCTYKCMYCMYVCAQRKITPTCEVSDAGCARALLAGLMFQRIIPASYGQCEEKQRHTGQWPLAVAHPTQRLHMRPHMEPGRQGGRQPGTTVVFGAMRHRS